MEEIPRLRMFAGPNGSGKSTLKDVVRPHQLGTYLNADDLERSVKSPNGYPLDSFPFTLEQRDLSDRWRASGFPGVDTAERVPVVDRGRLRLTDCKGYEAAALTDILREKLIEHRASFSFETVMSHVSKVRLLERARNLNYRTYLYYIATEDPTINVARVKARAAQGLHDVPEQKVRARYERSLELLPRAIRASSRAYIFDNSTDDADKIWLAEFDDHGITLRMDQAELPAWFVTHVLNWLE
jgi:predicted ABC-type ATPase